MLDQIRCCFDLIPFNCHKQHILSLLVQCSDIGPIFFKEVDHFYVAMQPRKMQRCHSIPILNIDPRLELILKRRIILGTLEILLGKSLEMQDVNLQLRHLVLPTSKMQQTRTVLLPHQRKVQLRTVLEVTTQVLVALQGHDARDWLAVGRLGFWSRSVCHLGLYLFLSIIWGSILII